MEKDLKIILLSLLSGFMFSVAFTQLLIFLACVSIVPLFVFLRDSSKKSAIVLGFMFGLGIGVGMFYWMIKGVSYYTGNGVFYGLLVALFSSVLLGLYFAVVAGITRTVWKYNVESRGELILNRLCVAAVWTILECTITYLLQAFPLHNFRVGLPFVTNLYAIQLTSIGGLPVLTFLTVLINLFLSEFYMQRKRIYLLYSASILLLIFLTGAICFYDFTPEKTGKSFKVAVVSDNTNPEVKWNEQTGDKFAASYFKLCKDAVALKPDFIIWPEAALPWLYSAEDELLQEIIKISSGYNITHVMGVNREITADKKLYNSVLYLNDNNDVTGIYNKETLLKGIEEPLGKILVPFLTQEGFVLSRGENQQPVKTQFGVAGNLICNEVVVETSGAEQVKKGATFLFNFSNDGWFKDTYISNLHFYYARIQAVANRKDISIANNCGINGIINSDGTIVLQKKESTGTLVSAIIQPNKNVSLFTKFPMLFPVVLALFLLIVLLITQINTIRLKKISS
jgi:apolipoprotein N-acyltransferase